MIKHTIKDDLIHFSIAKADFSYRIPIKKLGNTTDWKIGEKEDIVIENVSTWMLQLFTKKVTAEKYIKQFESIVQEYATNNTINWEQTLLAVKIQNEYNWLISTNKNNDDKEIISSLKKKYKLN